MLYCECALTLLFTLSRRPICHDSQYLLVICILLPSQTTVALTTCRFTPIYQEVRDHCLIVNRRHLIFVFPEWITGDTGLNSNWTINESSTFVYLQMDLTAPGTYQEIDNRPQDATLYHCIKKVNRDSPPLIKLPCMLIYNA